MHTDEWSAGFSPLYRTTEPNVWNFAARNFDSRGAAT